MCEDVNDDVQTPTDDLRARHVDDPCKVTRYYLEYSVDTSKRRWRRSGLGFVDFEFALQMLDATKRRAHEMESMSAKLYAPERHVDWRLIQETTYRLVMG